MSERSNTDQSEFWRSAQQWVDHQDLLDTLMQPVLDRLMDEADLADAARVLDIGCGTGASTMAAARAVGPSGHVTGADISDIMLDLARRRSAQTGLENIDYIEADAQLYPFAEGRFDTVISRFGVMFFGDPVAAFRNIARALRPGGSLVFLAWSGLVGNPWFDAPRRAAIDVLGSPEPADPRAPGPMAFQERAYVAGILEDAGWRDIRTSEIALELAPKGTAADIAAFATQLGPASRIIKDMNGTSSDTRQIEALVANAMMQYDTGRGVSVPAALNLVQARR